MLNLLLKNKQALAVLVDDFLRDDWHLNMIYLLLHRDWAWKCSLSNTHLCFWEKLTKRFHVESDLLTLIFRFLSFLLGKHFDHL